MKTEFLTKDITDSDFIEQLAEKIKSNFGNAAIDVLVGGPPCQSFSLAGERRKNDKKDDLFSYYLKVLEAFRPKYFVMENVYGILTKDSGKIKERILREIRNVVDYEALETFVEQCSKIQVPAECKKEFSLALEVLRISLSNHKLASQRRIDYLAAVEHISEMKLTTDQEKFVRESILKNKPEISNPTLEAFCFAIRYRYLEQKLTDIGVRIASIIGSNTRNTRAEEIEEYLEQHPEITSFCVIDDDKPSNRLKEHWIKTATGAGLDESNVEAAVAMLSFCK